MIFEQMLLHEYTAPVIIRESPLVEAGFLCDMHFHSELEFLHIISGAVECSTDGSSVVAYPDDIVFINSKTPHVTNAVVDNTLYVLLQFNNPIGHDTGMHHLMSFLNQSDTPMCLLKSDNAMNPSLRNYITEIMEENKQRDTAYDCRITANMYNIVAFLYRSGILPTPEKLSENLLIKRILPVLEYIDENYEENLTLTQLSRILNLNEQYFCRLFKKATGGTTTDYLNFVRVSKAEAMLKDGANVSSAAYKVGFSSMSYFNRVFKKYKLCSPQAYKRMMRNAELM